ncbi:hypothetical protein DdX_22117 [Ditylenchus destructor]|uniref:Uncharacterized protein n=1 Tax=Ditylenchus destructor TaxID=166010 RepID=A0AAD4MDY7_9BILA|nr:hypothetical protein DdX_22117 [Ditylenchus destructor]
MSTDGIGESLLAGLRRPARAGAVRAAVQHLDQTPDRTGADDLSRMTVFVANRFKLDWIGPRNAGKIAAMAEKMYGSRSPSS